MYERILVPLDRSQPAEVALGHAEAIARKFDSKLLLLHVHSEPGERSRCECEGYLNAIRDRLERSGLSVEATIRAGVPADEILRHAGQHSASLIVMASHGLTAHRVVLDATVSHEVIQQSHVPILLVRPSEFRTET